MQVRKTLLPRVVSVVIAMFGSAAYAADDGQSSPQSAQIAATSASRVAGDAASAAPSTTATVSADTQPPAFGVAMTDEQLDERRGGDALVGQNFLTGTVAENVASKVVTGSNTISDGSFASSSGLPTVIQNTGANVLIQNATVLNVRFGN